MCRFGYDFYFPVICQSFAGALHGICFDATANLTPEQPNGEENVFAKRVVGMSGETVEIKDGRTYINGEYDDESD